MKRLTQHVKLFTLLIFIIWPLWIPQKALAKVVTLQSWTNNCSPSGNIPDLPDPSCLGSQSWSNVVLQNTSAFQQTIAIRAEKFYCILGDSSTSACGGSPRISNYAVTIPGNSTKDLGKLSQSTPAGCGSAQTDYYYTDTNGSVYGPYWGLAYAGKDCPMSPTPKPTLVPCHGPCSSSSQCVQSCPICSKNGTCEPAPSRVPCGGPCSSSSQCVQSCPICTAGGTCAAEPTAKPTRVPCGGPCSSSSQCVQSCPICTAGGTCAAAPTATPTLVPCGGPCSSSSQCVQSCPICTAGGTCAAPTPTPLVSCNCDGIDATGTFYSGSTFTITGHAKVENPSTNLAKVLNMVYTLYKENTIINTSPAIPAVGPVAGVDTNGTPVDRYSSTWSATIPQTGSYKVVEKINCAKRTSMIPQSIARNSNVIVLADSYQSKPGLFDSIKSFFSSFFGGSTQNVTQQNNPVDHFSGASPEPTITSPSTLKLEVVGPKVTTLCHEVDFEVPL